MILIIDAYNILKQVNSNLYITERDRTAFLQALNNYAAIKKHIIIVVFDGGPSIKVTKEKMGVLNVIYSGAQQSADDYIRSYIEQNKQYDIVLISSDRALTNWAQTCNVESIDSGAFYALVKRITQASTAKQPGHNKAVKIAADSNERVDALMEEGSQQAYTKQEEPVEQERKRTSRQRSKQERKLEKKIRKL